MAVLQDSTKGRAFTDGENTDLTHRVDLTETNTSTEGTERIESKHLHLLFLANFLGGWVTDMAGISE